MIGSFNLDTYTTTPLKRQLNIFYKKPDLYHGINPTKQLSVTKQLIKKDILSA